MCVWRVVAGGAARESAKNLPHSRRSRRQVPETETSIECSMPLAPYLAAAAAAPCAKHTPEETTRRGWVAPRQRQRGGVEGGRGDEPLAPERLSETARFAMESSRATLSRPIGPAARQKAICDLV